MGVKNSSYGGFGTGPVGLTPNGMLVIDGMTGKPAEGLYLWEGKFYREPPKEMVEKIRRNQEDYVNEPPSRIAVAWGS